MSAALGDQSILLSPHEMLGTYTLIVGFLWGQRLHIELSLYIWHRQDIAKYIFLKNSTVNV